MAGVLWVGRPERESSVGVSMADGGIWLVVSFLRHLGHVSGVDEVALCQCDSRVTAVENI